MCDYYDLLVCDVVQFGRSGASQHSLFYREDADSSSLMSQYVMFTFLVSARAGRPFFGSRKRFKIFLSSLQNR